MQTAPILLFTFNRIDHLSRTIRALKANTLACESDLIVFSDGARNAQEQIKVDAVRRMISEIQGFRSLKIITREKNMGLAANVIDGVSQIIGQYGRVIVLEDDLVTSPYFLEFMNEGLELYAHNEKVMNVQAHVLHTRYKMPESFFISYANSWGWGTWQRAWTHFQKDAEILIRQMEQQNRCAEFDMGNRYPFTRMLRRQASGEINSWAIRWNATIFLNNGLSLNAGRSLIKNIGTEDCSGTNFSIPAKFKTRLYTQAPIRINTEVPICEDKMARIAIGKANAHEYSKITKASRIIEWGIRRLISAIKLTGGIH